MGRRYKGATDAEALSSMVKGERRVAASGERARILNLLVELRTQYRKPITENNITEEALRKTLKAVMEVESINWDIVRAAIASDVLDHAIVAIKQ